MAKTRPHCAMTPNTTEMPITDNKELALGRHGRAAVTPSGEVSRQKGSHSGSSPHHKTPYERGFNPDIGHRREHTAPGGYPSGARNMRHTAMPRTGHQSATAPGALAYPGSERNSATADARSSVPMSIQEGANCRDRFGSSGMYEKVNGRMDNAELDDGIGTGRRSRGNFRGSRRL